MGRHYKPQLRNQQQFWQEKDFQCTVKRVFPGQNLESKNFQWACPGTLDLNWDDLGDVCLQCAQKALGSAESPAVCYISIPPASSEKPRLLRSHILLFLPWSLRFRSLRWEVMSTRNATVSIFSPFFIKSTNFCFWIFLIQQKHLQLIPQCPKMLQYSALTKSSDIVVKEQIIKCCIYLCQEWGQQAMLQSRGHFQIVYEFHYCYNL